MGLWTISAGDPWQSSIFGPYANVRGDYWNCSTASIPVCGNYTDNLTYKNSNRTLIGQWHQLLPTCSIPDDCLPGKAVGYAPKNHSIVMNNQTIIVHRVTPPLMVNESNWAKVKFEGGSVVDFNASKPWGWDEPMPICVFPLSGTYGQTQRIWYYVTLALSISDFIPDLLRLVSIGNVVTSSTAAAIQLIQLYPYRPSESKIVDLDAVASAHILAITMWATVFWTIYSRIFGERLKPAYKMIAHIWLLILATAFLIGTRARYWTTQQLEIVESAAWYRFTSACYVNLGGATDFWGSNAFANSSIRSVSEAVVIYLPRDTMHSFAYKWDCTPFHLRSRLRGPPLRTWLVLPAFFTLIVGTLVPRPVWPAREPGELWPKYWWRRRKGKANFVMLCVLGPACAVAWPGLISWRSYTALFNNPAFPPAESPTRIGQYSTTLALGLAIFTGVDRFVPGSWKREKGGKRTEGDGQTEGILEAKIPQQQHEALDSGTLEQSSASSDLRRAEEGIAARQGARIVGSDGVARRAEVRRSATVRVGLGVEEDLSTTAPKRSVTQ